MLFWRSRNYEKELELLGEKVRKANEAALKSQRLRRRMRGLFILYSVILYVLYLVIAITTGSWSQHRAKIIITGAPGLIYGLHKVLVAFLTWRETRSASHLKALENRRDGLIEEYKEKVNYSQIQKVLGSADKGETKSKSGSTKSSTEKAIKSSKKAPTKETKSDQKISKTDKQLLIEQIKRDQKKSPATESPQTNKNIPAANTQDISPPLPMQPSALPGFQQQSSVATPSHTWMDRLADLVLGENEQSPNSRVALICPICFCHNGLAPYGKTPEDVYYRCPACGIFNGKKPAPQPAEKDDQVADKHQESQEMKEI